MTRDGGRPLGRRSPPDRIFGLEVEYGLTHAGDLDGLPRDTLSRKVLQQQAVPTTGGFLANGGRAYVDVGSHVEYATPETTSPEQATVASLAGDLLLSAGAREAFRTRVLPVPVQLVRNNRDTAGDATFGCHENYSLRRGMVDVGLLMALLASHVASRACFAGAGSWRTDGGGFELSQRAPHIFRDVTATSTRSRPLVSTRDEPHADGLRRLHVVGGDTNVAPAATQLKLASTDLLLSALAHADQRRRRRLEGLRLADPVRAVKALSSDPTLTVTARDVHGRPRTAVEHQLALAEAVAEATRGWRSDRQSEALAVWRDTLETLDAEPARLLGRVDWITKRALAGATRRRRAAVEIAYHSADPTTSLYWRLVARRDAPWARRARRLRAAAERAVDRPPETRAVLRGRLVAAVAATDGQVGGHIEWALLRFHRRGRGTSLGRVQLPDPHRNHHPRVADLEDRIRRHAA